MMQFSYIFWDNDGVLVDTERLYFRASQEALAQIGIALQEEQFISLSLDQGRSVFELAEQTGHPERQLEQLRDWRNRRYTELLRSHDTVIPGVRELLRRLTGKLGMAIVTSSRKDHFDVIHSVTGLLQCFDFILTREDYLRSKPSPEPYLLALQRSGCPPERCLVIEDSPRGLTAAKAAGLACWVIPGLAFESSRFAGADRVFSGITELAEELD